MKRLALGLALALSITWPSLVAAADYSPTLTVSGSFTIAGCGYDAALGPVTVTLQSPVGYSWTGADISDGCISVSNFGPVGDGAYVAQAWQAVHHNTKVVAQVAFALP